MKWLDKTSAVSPAVRLFARWLLLEAVYLLGMCLSFSFTLIGLVTASIWVTGEMSFGWKARIVMLAFFAVYVIGTLIQSYVDAKKGGKS